jgi:WD40 repeat protein
MSVNAPKFRVSYQILDSTNQIEDKSNLHCFAVNAFDVDESKQRLYTAGRDSTVKCWNIAAQNEINYLYSLENHSNWVNDVVLCSPDVCKFISVLIQSELIM